MFNQDDTISFQKRGISDAEILKQLEILQKRLCFVDLYKAADLSAGIISLSRDEVDRYIDLYDTKADIRVIKFVPASGAATRMFKDLYAFCDEVKKAKDIDETLILEQNPTVKHFFNNLDKFAFYNDLNNVLLAKGKSIVTCIENAEYSIVLECFLNDGIKYGKLPKALLKFHKYDKDANRTPLEEQLVEAANYASRDKVSRLHFTISDEFIPDFDKKMQEVLPEYEKKFDLKYEISHSVQHKSTDTIALDANNNILRDKENSIVFRPAGHGALIHNLNNIDADIVFIKNIDNIRPEPSIGITIDYKKALAGILLDTRDNIFDFLVKIDKKIEYIDKIAINTCAEPESQSFVEDVYRFISEKIGIELSLDIDFNKTILPIALKALLQTFKSILNRPIRVCGMVRNEGEPGGGPFWVNSSVHSDKSIYDSIIKHSLQIVESSQIDIPNKGQHNILMNSNFFNPVDLVCSLTDYKGGKFNLLDYVDANTAFVSEKTFEGKQIKAMELPGLWNGAMAHWISLFVEVPKETFSPVKMVNDLLREEHLVG